MRSQETHPPKLIPPPIRGPVAGCAAAGASSSGGTRTARAGAPPGPPVLRSSETAGGRP
jgi:hypothetical protein